MKEINAVGIALINSEKQVLIAQRPKHKEMADKWEFPGGKIESGESPKECIIREIKEELDVDIDPYEYIGSETFPYKEYQVTLQLYSGKIVGNETITLHEHQAIEWVNVNDLHRFDFPAVDLPFIPKLEKLISEMN